MDELRRRFPPVLLMAALGLTFFVGFCCGAPPAEASSPGSSFILTSGKESVLIPRSVLFGNPQKASARISPNGKWLSFLAPVDGILNVWVAPAENLDAAKPVTDDKTRDIRGIAGPTRANTFSTRKIKKATKTGTFMPRTLPLVKPRISRQLRTFTRGFST